MSLVADTGKIKEALLYVKSALKYRAPTPAVLSEIPTARRKLASIEDSSSDAIIIVTLSGTIVSWNHAAETIFGYSSQEIIGKSATIIFKPQEHQELDHILMRVRKEHRFTNFDAVRVRKDGSFVEVSISAVPVRNIYGKVTGATIISRDVTAQRWAEDALRKYADRVHDLYNRAPCGYHSINLNGTFVEMNDTELDWLGLKREEVIGRLKFTDLLRTEDLPFFESKFELFLKQGYVYNVEINLRRRDGTYLPVLLNSIAMRDGHGRIIMSRATIIDLTERKQYENELENRVIERTRDLEQAVSALQTEIKRREKSEIELEKMNSVLRNTLESTTDGILVTAKDNNFLACNRQFFEMWGFTSQTLTQGFEKATQFAADQLKNPDQFIQRVKDITFSMDKPEVDILEFKDGRIVERYTKPFQSSGKDEGRVYSFRDVTKFKENERQLKANMEELGRSNADLEQFASVISHDLKAPLTTIACYAQMLERHYRDRFDSRTHGYLAFIVSRVFKMSELIDDVLSYGRVSLKEKKFNPCDCKAILKTVTDNLEVAIRDADAVIECDFLPEVFGDATQLMQLFQNLIGNAIKFRGKNPPIIKISAYQNQENWIFAIRDNGIGMPKESQGRIFKIFERVDDKTKVPGTGVGLAICKKIVEQHGGKIWVESVEGEGSSFFFAMPMAFPKHLVSPQINS